MGRSTLWRSRLGLVKGSGGFPPFPWLFPWARMVGRQPQFWLACWRGPGPRAQSSGQHPLCRLACRRGPGPWAQSLGRRPLCWLACQRGPGPRAWRAGRRPKFWFACLRDPGPWAQSSGRRPLCRSACWSGPGPRAGGGVVSPVAVGLKEGPQPSGSEVGMQGVWIGQISARFLFSRRLYWRSLIVETQRLEN